ncbi:radical SAM protein [Desulfopila sp. IMCC35008]|uniref:radical SAM protein n=1 Tax=Desulfopila sp. IMCC35008 TaxID=2653858 RepID=UPI0013D15BC6|nr:radical SAM protein [Desulfopila sp. IMCC35008]
MYHGTTYTPPVETDTMLLQVTVGCKHNKCSYCNMYKELPYCAVEMERIAQELQYSRSMYSKAERIFLVDGDPLSLPTDRLLEIWALTHHYFPECKTLSTYGSVRSLAEKSDEDLSLLEAAGFNDFYIGIESGSEDIIKNVNKGITVIQAREQLNRLNSAGIDHISLIMLGIGGKDKGVNNARMTAELINSTSPKMIWASTLGVFEGTQLHDDVEKGLFNQASELEVLEEEKELIRNINLQNVPFYGTHITNTIPVSGLVTRDSNRMLETIDMGIDYLGEKSLQRTFDRASL